MANLLILSSQILFQEMIYLWNIGPAKIWSWDLELDKVFILFADMPTCVPHELIKKLLTKSFTIYLLSSFNITLCQSTEMAQKKSSYTYQVVQAIYFSSTYFTYLKT